METTNGDSGLREAAIKRLKEKRDFAAHVMAYVAVNAFLIAIWAFATSRGFFWPMFPLFGWGIGLFFHWWSIYMDQPSEAEIQREMERLKQR